MKLEELVQHSLDKLEPIDRSRSSSSILLSFADLQSKIEPWGANWMLRDSQLRSLFLTEPFLCAAVYNVAATRSAFSWKIEGPPKTARLVQEMLNGSEYQHGFSALQLKVAVDVLTQDNGGFVHIVRKHKGNPSSAVVSLHHLDAARCYRTGNHLKPVIYIDSEGQEHILSWYEVMTFEDMPHPSYNARGRQVCFVSRVLKAAETIKAMTQYKDEKISGRYSRAIHVVSGVANHEIEDAKKIAQIQADNQGLMHYMEPIILTTLDPSGSVGHVKIDMASLPEGFSESEQLKWYITLIAMAAGGEYQDFSPLPGGNLGTSSQSETLHRKAQAKGHALWMKLWETKMRATNILPRSVAFRFLQQDAQAELEKAIIAEKRATERKIRIESGEITQTIAQQIAVDSGDLKAEYLLLMGQQDETPITTVYDDEPPDANKPIPFSIADEAAKAIVGLVIHSKVQAVAPIDNLEYLQEAIRSVLKTECVIGTTEHWLTDQLIDAAYIAGLSPKALRDRLPSNKLLFVKSDRIQLDGTTIYRKSRPAQTPPDTPPKQYHYDIQTGWREGVGSLNAPRPFLNLAETIANTNVRNLPLCANWAYRLGGGDDQLPLQIPDLPFPETWHKWFILSCYNAGRAKCL